MRPIAANGAFAAVAEGYAHTLLGMGTLSHTAGGVDVWSRATSAGYAGVGPVGETLWMGGGALAPGDTVSGWMNSPPHAGIILDGAYTQGGAGCFIQAGPTIVCVLIVAA